MSRPPRLRHRLRIAAKLGDFGRVGRSRLGEQLLDLRQRLARPLRGVACQEQVTATIVYSAHQGPTSAGLSPPTTLVEEF